MKKRGLKPSDLEVEYEKLADPFLLPDMEKAVARIEKAVKNREKVLIYGDYDVDGVTASTVMAEALEKAGLRGIQIMLPNRFVDGYGMSEKVVSRAKEMGVTLVITVDTGSANKEIVQELTEVGVETIVTDHHECLRELPEAVAVVNPKRRDIEEEKLKKIEETGLFDLCGAGVAFKVAQAMVSRGLIPAGQEKWLLDLVVIGTICDSMKMTRENHILGHYGMIVLEKTRRAGLKEMLSRMNVKKISSDTIGFQIGPRLNAAGRMETAEIALNLLRAKNGAEAAKYAEKLEELNKERKFEQGAAMKEIEQRRDVDGDGILDKVIVETGKWNEGVIGIIAGKLVEKYRRPAIVLTEVEKGILKGSGRSFGEFSLAEALKNCSDLLINGGGHAEAAGMKLKKENAAEFVRAINSYYESLELKSQEKFLKETADIEVSGARDLDLELAEEMAKLEPFGEGNQRPIFRIRGARVLDVRRMGKEGQHLSLSIQGNDGVRMKTVAFFAPEEWFQIEPGSARDLMIRLAIDEWNGRRNVEGELVEID